MQEFTLAHSQQTRSESGTLADAGMTWTLRPNHTEAMKPCVSGSTLHQRRVAEWPRAGLVDQKPDQPSACAANSKFCTAALAAA